MSIRLQILTGVTKRLEKLLQHRGNGQVHAYWGGIISSGVIYWEATCDPRNIACRS